jgi:CheY-like chemotaxis protein
MKEKILVVDDDPSIVHLLTANLEEEGYAVISGYDGQAAIQLSKTAGLRLILMDLNMPVTNGLKALESIRRQKESKQIPVVLLTGEASDKVIPDASEAARVTHIKKPVDLEDLNSLVKSLLKEYPA